MLTLLLVTNWDSCSYLASASSGNNAGSHAKFPTDLLPVPRAVSRRQRLVRLQVSYSNIHGAKHPDTPGIRVVKGIQGEAGYKVLQENLEDEELCISLNPFLLGSPGRSGTTADATSGLTRHL